MKYIFLCISFLITLQSSAVTTHNFTDPVLQKRYNDLIQDIRCPVCQGQSIGGSDAPLAQDLRTVVADMLTDNRSDGEIFQFMVERYGDFAVFKPPVNYHTYILWIGPFAFIGFSILTLVLRKRNSVATPQAPTNIDSASLTTAEEILKDKES